MITPEIISYIKNERGRGISDLVIRSTLAASGWVEKDISEALVASVSSMSGVKEYQRKVMWFIFAVWITPYVFWVTASVISSSWYFSMQQMLFMIMVTIAAFLIVYAASFVVAKGSEPNINKSKEVIDIIVRIIGAGGIILFLSIALLYAGCLFIMATVGSINI